MGWVGWAATLGHVKEGSPAGRTFSDGLGQSARWGEICAPYKARSAFLLELIFPQVEAVPFSPPLLSC